MSETEKGNKNPRLSATDDGTPTMDAAARENQEVEQKSHEEQPNESIPVPMRTGFLSFLVIIPPIANTTHYSRRTKWMLTIIVALAALAAPLGSNILLPVLVPISEYFHTSPTVVNLSVALYALAVGITPLWWSHIAENHGRRVVYLLTFLLLCVFNVLCAVSTSMGMFIGMRLLAGGACASVQAVGAGTIADLWEPQERGKAVGIFSLGPMLGPLVAPIIGGALTIQWNWRSTQWFLVIYGFVIWVAMIFLLPETSTKLKMSRQEEEEEEGEDSISHNLSIFTKAACKAKQVAWLIVSPVASVKLLVFMPILITVYYTSITFASNYLLNISIQTVFSSPPYQWSTLIVGLAYIPSSLGAVLGAIIGGRWTDYCMKRAAYKAGRVDGDGKLVFYPEDRISENALVASIMYPAALLWWGWSADKHVFWLVPLIANFFFGFGFMLISSVTTTVMTEFVPRKTTSGVAVTNLVRNSMGCGAAIVAQPLINAIGNCWLFTIAFFVCLLSAAIVVLMKRNRERWSEKMRSTIDQTG